MKRTKRFYPRRIRALRRLAIALALLLFCNCVLHVGLLLPIQALRVCEQSEGVYERTRVVWRRWEPNMMHLVDALYLTESENTLSLFCTHPGLSGWLDGFVWPVDTSDGGDVQAGAVSMARGDREPVIVFYGRVKGTEGLKLTANVRTEDWNDAENGPHIHVYGHEIGKEDCLVRDGYTYFIFVESNPVPKDLRNRLPAYHQLIVNRGEEHIEYEIERGASVFWG